jgi:hypothetical protein
VKKREALLSFTFKVRREGKKERKKEQSFTFKGSKKGRNS